MSFKSFLSAVGHDLGVAVKAVFGFLGSAQGQATVAGVEAGAVSIASLFGPVPAAAVTAFEGLFNSALKEILSVEASAAAAGMQSGTGAQKLAAVTAALAPQVGALLKSIGIPNPTDAEVQSYSTTIANALVTILNAIPAPAAKTA